MKQSVSLLLFSLCLGLGLGSGSVQAQPSTDVVSFTVALPLRENGLKALRDQVLSASSPYSSDYGHYLTQDEILSLVAPSPSNISIVQNKFQTAGIACLNWNVALRCYGTRPVVYKFFSMLSTRSDYVIPESIRDNVLFVEGLTATYHKNSIYPKHNVNSTGGVDTGYVGREVLQKLYNIPNITKVSESLGAIEYQNQSGFSTDDVAASQTGNGQPQNPVKHVVGTDVWPDTETELDLQMLSQTAQGADLWFDGSSQWLYTWAVQFFNTKEIPYVVSHSWGWAIDQQCTIITCNNQTSEQFVNTVNNLYMMIVARGVTMTVASGDSGAPGRSDEVCTAGNRTVVPVFPGSSPWVVSVGATFVVSDPNRTVDWKTPLCQQDGCATGLTEETVNTNNVSWTAGGGFSEFLTEGRTPWQDSVVSDYLHSGVPLPTYFSKTGRAYPDVSVIGHNCPTWQSGEVSPVDGTSCSSPTFAAIVGILNSHQLARGRSRLGLATPTLYAMHQSEPGIFNDITKGNNWCTETECCPTRKDGGSDFGYLAIKGWDPVTGLGTPNVGKMLKWLDTHT